jgi:hypothetical protein
MLGNLYLMRAISGPEFSLGDALCAAAVFKSAKKALHSGANPALMASILSSEAILRLFMSHHTEKRSTLFRRAKATFEKAGRLAERSRNVSLESHIWTPIEANLIASQKVLPTRNTRK